jgi:anti-anti-sigma factor
MAPLGITTDVAEGGVAVLGVAGELVMDTADELTAAVAAVAGDERVTRVVIDLAQVVFLDMAGLSTLLQSRTDALRAGVSLRVIGPHGLVRRVLRLTDTCLLLGGEPAPVESRRLALAAPR